MGWKTNFIKKTETIALIVLAICLALLLKCASGSSYKTYVLPTGEKVRCKTMTKEGPVIVLSDCDNDETYLITSTEGHK